jgi:hypothetical protein
LLKDWSWVLRCSSSRQLITDFRWDRVKILKNHSWSTTWGGNLELLGLTVLLFLIDSNHDHYPFLPFQEIVSSLDLTRWVWYLWLIMLHEIYHPSLSSRWLPKYMNIRQTRLLFSQILSFADFFVQFLFAKCGQSIHKLVIFYRRLSKKYSRVWCWYVRDTKCVDAFQVVFLRSWRMLVGRLLGWWMSIL